MFPLVSARSDVDSKTSVPPSSLISGLRLSDCSGVFVNRINVVEDCVVLWTNGAAVTASTVKSPHNVRRSIVRVLLYKFLQICAGNCQLRKMRNVGPLVL